MQCAVGSFVVPSGTSDLVVTDVVDRTGANVTAEVVLFFSAYAVINTLTAGAIPIGGYSDFRGIDTGSVRSLWANSDAYSPFNFKAADTGQSLGNHSIMDIWTDNFGQGQIYRQAKIKSGSIAPGTFTIEFTSNARSGDSILYVAFSGVTIEFKNWITGTYSTSEQPQGLLSLPLPFPASSGGTSWGTGGNPVNWGFAVPDGTYGTSDLVVVNQGNNFSAQLTDTLAVSINQTTGVLTKGATVTDWDDLAFTLANASGIGSVIAAFCGENIVCKAGQFTAGDSSFDTGIDTIALFMVSNGYAVSTSIQSPIGMLTYGWANGLNQIGTWSGEKTNGNVGPAYGARYLSNQQILRFGSPNGASTTFDLTVAIDSISPFGPVTLTNTGTAAGQQILWFAIGIASPEPPPSAGGGIYVLVPRKKQDTVWIDVNTEDEALFKIPDPNAYTSLIGDE